MNDASECAVRARRDLARDLDRFFERDRSLFDAFGQRRALNQLHDEIIGADVVERADVRMVERRIARASRSKRSLNLAVDVLMATSRPRRWSRAR